MRIALVSARTFDIPGRGLWDCLPQDLIEYLNQLGFSPLLIPNKSIDAKGILAQIKPSLVVLSGGDDLGEDKQRDITEAMIFEACLSLGIPILAICRGMQFVFSIMGVNLQGVPNHLRAKTSLEGQFSETVDCYHKFGVFSVPQDFEIIGEAKDGSVEIAVNRNSKLFCVMFHPERSDISSLELLRLIKGFIDGQ